MPDSVELIPEQSPQSGGAWQPEVGQEFKDLLDRQTRLDYDQKEILERECVGVLSSCTSPKSASSDETGLVFGYVQSGKTLSFIATLALARDNRYQMVIVIAGTSVPLLKQSQERLAKELNLPPVGKNRKWRHFSNPSTDDLKDIRTVLDNWNYKDLSDKRKPTVLVTVMKETTYLGRLVALLRELDLVSRPVLIIDDEGDQASMDANASKPTLAVSAIHRHIINLKSAIPHHTLLQYTATPQAPLLISLFDTLSPSFIRVLTPGTGYVGGAQFFEPGSPYIERITNLSELPTQTSSPQTFPKSLRDAMQLFFLGVAAASVHEDIDGNRSMLVHPSQGTSVQNDYHRWVTRAIKDWLLRLNKSEEDPDRQSLVTGFEKSYKDLAQTVPDIPPFSDLLEHLPMAIQQTKVTLVNAAGGKTPSIPFNDWYAHIVVGGQAMDRGFTVEGLTVTYLPRGLGVGNADTLQQRARFFGYKKGYLGFCRVFLSDAVANAFESYVSHEEYIRAKLVEYQDSSPSLKKWRRIFKLDKNLRPTRPNILSLGSKRAKFGGKWFATLYLPHAEARLSNLQVVNSLKSDRDFSTWDGGPPTNPHTRCIAPMKEVLEKVLREWVNADSSESDNFLALNSLIEDFLKNNGAFDCEIFLMNDLKERERTLEDGQLKDQGRLFQGRGPNYIGDEQVRSKRGFTVQIHNILQINPKSDLEKHPFLLIAVYSPESMDEAMYIGEAEDYS